MSAPLPMPDRQRRRPSFLAPAAAALLCLSLLAVPVRAQPMADRVPDDAIVYVGWLGYDAKGPGYEGSHLKAVLELAEFRKLVDETFPKLMERLGQENREAAEAVNIARPILVPMLKHPTAIFVGTPDLPKDGQPMPRAGILCKAGADAEAMHLHVQNLMKEAPDEVRQMVKVSRAGDTVVLTVGYPNGLPEAGGKTLATSAGFKAAQAHMVKDASFAIYADVEKLVAVGDQAVTQYGPPDAQQMWPKVRDAVGLRGVKRFVWTSGFDGKEWMDHVFVAAPEPRPGLLALADPTPLSDAAFKSIPATATMAGASRFNLSKLITGIKDAVGKVEPRAIAEWDKGLAEANRRVGLDLQRDVVDALGDEWVYYVDPNTGGRGPAGAVFLNRLKDPAKAEAAFTKLEALANDEMAKAIKEKDVVVRFLTTKSGGTTVHYLGTPLISPSWAVKDGYLVLALFPQMVAGAADQIGAGKSILDNPDFQALRKQMGVTNANSVAWYDLPRTAPDSYATWVAISRLVNVGDIFGVPTPPMILPPLNKLMPHLSPAGTVSWTDKDGFYAKAVSPFPGATLLASDPLGGMIGILPGIIGAAAEQAKEGGRDEGSAAVTGPVIREVKPDGGDVAPLPTPRPE